MQPNKKNVLIVCIFIWSIRFKYIEMKIKTVLPRAFATQKKKNLLEKDLIY